MTSNASDPGSAPFIGEHIDQATRIACAVIGSVMVITAVFGNSTLSVIVLKNFLRNRKKNLHDLFIFNLVLDDLLLMGYWFVFFVLDLALGYHPVVDASHCTANGIFLIVVYMVNLDLLVSISFNRYLHVCHYHLYRRLFTLPSTATWCLLAWVFSLILALPPLWGGAAGFYFYNTRTHVCSYNRDGFTYLKVLVILYTIFPPLFIAYFNVAIFRFWRKARMSLTSRFPLAKTEQEKKKKFQITKWRTKISKKKAAPKSLDVEASEERAVHFQHHQSPPGLGGTEHRGQVADSYTVKHQTGALSEGADGKQIPSSSPDVEQIAHTLHGDNGDDAGVMTLNISGHCENATHESSSDSESGENDSFNNSEDSTSDDKAENRRQNDKTGGAGSKWFRGKTGTLIKTAKMISHHQAEETETETETDETRFDSDSRQWDSSTATATSSTALTSSTTTSSSVAAKKTTLSKRGKQQKQTKTAQNNQQQMRKRSQSREQAFVRSLLVVCLLALFTFLPYTALVMVDTYIKLPKEVHIAANLLVFLNNTVNWIVYGAMNQAFKRGYVKYARQILNLCGR